MKGLKQYRQKTVTIILLMVLVVFSLIILDPVSYGWSQVKNKGWVPDYNKRDKWQQPEKILDTIGIRQGMSVADVGCGTGYLTLRLAKRVGESGVVYASDISKDRINALKNKAIKAGFKNIITIHGNEQNPNLPEGKFDIIIMLHVIHIVIKTQDPQALLANIKPALKPDGILVLVHWDGPKMGYPEQEAYSRSSVLGVIKEAGFNLIREETFLPRDRIFILQIAGN